MSADLYATRNRPNYGQGQVVAYTGTAGTVANGLPQGAPAVLVVCTTLAYVRVGVDPTATTADLIVPALTATVIPIDAPSITGGSGLVKVSAVQVSAGGNLHVMPLTN